MKIDHIGYVTSNFKKTLEYFRDFIGLKVITKKILEPAHGVEVLFLEMGNNGYPAMEIIRPINNNSKIPNGVAGINVLISKAIFPKFSG